MTKLYVELDTNTTYTRRPDPEDSWDIGNTHTDVTYLGLRVADWSYESRDFRNTIETVDQFNSGDHAYVVLVRYTTGCTFGFREYLPEVMNAFLELKDAESLCDLIESAYKSNEYTIHHKNKEYYVGSWIGYFESLNDIEIREVFVK